MEFGATPREGETATNALIKALIGTMTFSTLDASHVNEELGIRIKAGKTMGGHFLIELEDNQDENAAQRLQNALTSSQISSENLHQTKNTPGGNVCKIWFLKIEDVETFFSVL